MINLTALIMAWMAWRHARDAGLADSEQFRVYHFETGCDWARLLRFAQDRNAGRGQA